MYRSCNPYAMTGEAHRFPYFLLCSHLAHPAPMLLETGFHVQMAGFETQPVMQHKWLHRRFLLCFAFPPFYRPWAWVL